MLFDETSIQEYLHFNISLILLLVPLPLRFGILSSPIQRLVVGRTVWILVVITTVGITVMETVVFASAPMIPLGIGAESARLRSVVVW